MNETYYSVEEQREHRKSLVAALRSGEYRQTTGQLRVLQPDGDISFCCLGVACEISELGVWDGKWYTIGEQVNSLHLPGAIVRYYGFVKQNGKFVVPGKEDTSDTLTDLNDVYSFTFSQIADIIEYEPEELFTS